MRAAQVIPRLHHHHRWWSVCQLVEVEPTQVEPPEGDPAAQLGEDGRDRSRLLRRVGFRTNDDGSHAGQ